MRQTLLRHSIKFALLPLLLFALPGCSNDPYPDDETSRPVVYRSIPELSRDLDPTKCGFEIDAMIIGNIYDTYYRYNYLHQDPYTLDLCLGAAEPVVTPYPFIDTSSGKPVKRVGQSWTFRIKQGLRFQDDPCFPGGKGREVLASDFIYAIRRLADPSLTSGNLSFVQDKILGYDEYVNYLNDRFAHNLGMDYTKPVPGLQLDTKDPYAFTIVTNQPFPQLRYLMAIAFTTPIAHEAVEKYGDLEKHPVGCGPYVMTEWTPKERWVLKVNPNCPPEYYPSNGSPDDRKTGLLDDAGKALPLNDEYDIEYITEEETAWNMFMQGYEDEESPGTSNFTRAVTAEGTLTPEMVKKGMQLKYIPQPDVSYLIFNMTDPVVGGYTPQKRKLRQAIMAAIDTQSSIDIFAHGVGIRAQFIIPPGLFGYDPNYQNPYSYNLVKAKQLLAEAGYPHGIDPKTGDRLTLYYDSVAQDAITRQGIEWTQKQLAAIGINLVSHEVRMIEWMNDSDHGKFQLETWGWIADYPDPQDFLMLLYGKNNRQVNPSAYENPEYDRLYEEMQGMNDGPQRLAIIKQMRDISVEDCPIAYSTHDVAVELFQGWVHNVSANPMCYDSHQYFRIDTALRDRMRGEWNQPIYWPIILFVAALVLSTIPAVGVVNSRKNRYVRKKKGGLAQ